MDDIDLEAPLILERLRRDRALRNFPIPRSLHRPRVSVLGPAILALILAISIAAGILIARGLQQPRELSPEQMAILKSLVYVLEDRHGIPIQRTYGSLHKEFNIRSIDDLNPSDYDDAVTLLLQFQDFAPTSAN